MNSQIVRCDVPMITVLSGYATVTMVFVKCTHHSHCILQMDFEPRKFILEDRADVWGDGVLEVHRSVASNLSSLALWQTTPLAQVFSWDDNQWLH